MKQCYNKLLAIDPSLNSSGWALFDILKESVISVGTLKAMPSSVNYFKRISDIQDKVDKLLSSLEIGKGDVILVETATTIKDPSATLKVEQVRTIFETLSRLRGAQVPGRINPRSIHYEILGLKGKQLARDSIKFAAVNVVSNLFSNDLERLELSKDTLSKNQDIVDALLIGSLGLVRINQAKCASKTLEEVLVDNKIKSRGAFWSEVNLNGLSYS